MDSDSSWACPEGRYSRRFRGLSRAMKRRPDVGIRKTRGFVIGGVMHRVGGDVVVCDDSGSG